MSQGNPTIRQKTCTHHSLFSDDDDDDDDVEDDADDDDYDDWATPSIYDHHLNHHCWVIR